MPRECPGCGATATPEARFCRRCGVPFKVGGGHDTDAPVSPMAQTIPLADDGRTTDGLWTEESQQLATGTSRLRRTEMEDMLRRVSREYGGDGDGHASYPPLAQEDRRAPLLVAHATSTLQTPVEDAPAHKTSSTTTTTATKARVPRRPHLWQWALLILLCGTLATGLLAFISYRRSSVAKAGDIPVVPVTEEKQQDASAETSSQPEQATAASAQPPASTTTPAPARARSSAEESSSLRPASETSGEPTPPPAPSPPTRQTTTTPPALSASEHYQRGVQLWDADRRAALEEFRAAAAAGVPDAYYYLGSEYYPEGRDPKTLSEGELRAALNYFLRAGGGPHSAQASRAAQALGKEYERRKKHSGR